jgi:hypothetical protein
MIQNRAGPGRCCPDMKIEEGVCQGCGNKPSTSDEIEKHIAECECEQCKAQKGLVKSTSPQDKVFIAFSIECSENPLGKRTDEFYASGWLERKRYDAIKEVFIDEFMMTLKKVRE